jgi:hypothetical protein
MAQMVRDLNRPLTPAETHALRMVVERGPEYYRNAVPMHVWSSLGRYGLVVGSGPRRRITSLGEAALTDADAT